MSFVFYDTEATGTETAFDQILQFAAIKTDADLNEIDRLEIRCRLMPHVVPAAGAMRVTGIRASQLSDIAHCSHYEMVRKIRAKFLEWSPAVFIGYNSLDFDEHLLRQSFYKTLHPPYLTNTNGNCRADALRIVRAASMFAPGALNFPLDYAGKQVFKLDEVAPANGFNHDAHDAMGDVLATIHLCRQLMERAPAVWSNAMRFSQKAAVIDYVNEERVFCLTEFYGGKPYSSIVTPIGTAPDNKSEFVVYDLQFDPAEIAAKPDDDLISRLGYTPKPVRRLRSNSGPTLVPSDRAPSIAAASFLSAEELDRRADILQAEEALRNRLIACFQQTRTVHEPSPYIERQLYGGEFFPRIDEFLMERFHTIPWEDRLALMAEFEDRRLRVLARSLIYMERPDLFNSEMAAKHDLARARRLLGPQEEVPWLTLPKAIEEIDLMIADCEGRDLALLQEHREYLMAWLSRTHASVQTLESAVTLAVA